VCLSGGIDSNAIISMMTRLRTGQESYPLHAFSYIPPEFSEAEYIHDTIEHTGAVLNELQCTPRELWDQLPAILWYHDEPVHSPTALIGFQLMRLARARGAIVVLNGQGADEVNAGYHAYFRTYWTDLLRNGEWGRARRQMSAYAEGHGRPQLPLLAGTLAHWLRSEFSESGAYVRARRLVNSARRARSDWYVEDFAAKVDRTPTSNPRASLRSALVRSVEQRPLPLYLRVEDRNSMAHSVEARLPFLDYRLVSLAFSLPAEWKLHGPWNKYIVREAMRGVIAEPVRMRKDKMGFPTPSARWLAGDWFEPIRDVLASKTLRESGICNVDQVLKTLDDHRAGHADLSDRLFHLAEFAMWLDAASSPSSATAAPPTDRSTSASRPPRPVSFDYR
jgi:asparagine synthase (glutamine-hydrolysing)